MFFEVFFFLQIFSITFSSIFLKNVTLLYFDFQAMFKTATPKIQLRKISRYLVT